MNSERNATTDGEIERLSIRFGQFSGEARDLVCPLYEHLSRQIAQDEEILAIARYVRRPPAPNVLFAVVHFLLMEHTDHPLARYYGSLCETPLPAGDAYPRFRDFLISHRLEAIPLLQTRITQTNEVRRCSYLLPSFTEVYESAGRRPLALIDVGCSAGLHLLWNRYHYDYGQVQTGNPASPVTIACELRGSGTPGIPDTLPPCAFSLGIDLNPVDLADPIERRWFEALIWPDHAERRKLTKAAIGELLDHPPHTVRGDAVDALAGQLKTVPPDTTLIVYHCHALCQASPEDIEAFGGVLRAFSAHRPLYWLSCEGSEVLLRTVRDGRISERKLANKDGHGRWLAWR